MKEQTNLNSKFSIRIKVADDRQAGLYTIELFPEFGTTPENLFFDLMAVLRSFTELSRISQLRT